MTKFVRLSQGNHRVNWTPWSRLARGVYSLSLILSCSTSTRPSDTSVTVQSTPMCPPNSTTSLDPSLAISSVRTGTKSCKVSWRRKISMIFFWINETHYLQCLLLSLVCWLWDSIWMIVTLTLARCFLSLFSSLYTYTYTYTYCYYDCILCFLVLTKPAPVWVPVKASFSTSDTIVTLYRHQSTNRFVSLNITFITILKIHLFLFHVFCSIHRLFVYLLMRMSTSKQQQS